MKTLRFNTCSLILATFGCLPLGVSANEAASASASAASPAKPACCCAPATPASVASVASVAAAALTERSIYQLDATWTNDAGEPVSLATLRGRPVVLTMFFASCEYACPILVNDMQRIRQTLPEAVRERAQFVLVSFDDARDTPAALRAYRERASLDANWMLLHGDAANVQELAMLLGVKYQRDARGQYAHSNLITVLNAEGEIVHQRNGLQGEVSQAANAVKLAAK